MIKVLFVCTVPTERSGIPNVIFNLLNSFEYDKFSIGYVSINEPSNFYKAQLNSINAKLFVIPRKITHPLRYIYKLAKVAKGYDIIHVHGNSATMVLEMLAAKIAGVKVRIAHSHNTTCNVKLIDKLARPLFYTLCDSRMACGIEAGKWLFCKRDFKVVNNGINTANFEFDQHTREIIRKQYGVDKEKVIGHIGNFNFQKNHDFLIDIYSEIEKKMPDTKLLLLGDGALKGEIQKKVEDLGISDKVIFTGNVYNPQAYLNMMDIVIMPSRFEGLPLTLVEEQANGLSILASDAITKDANLTGKITYLSLNESPEYWAAKAIELLSQAIRTKEVSIKNILYIKSLGYDIATSTKDLMNTYQLLLG